MADMVVRFWGVRGSVPVPGPTSLRYGGNTACVELRCGPHRVILDAGTGLRELGDALMREEGPLDADLVLTHPHLDHLMGLPFFAPAYETRTALRLWQPEKDHMAALIRPPYCPVPLAEMGARIEGRVFAPGAALALGYGIAIATIAVKHPGGAVGLRIAYDGGALIYLTDMEFAESDAAALARFCAHADVMICDAMYTDEEKADHAGWGHSSWQDAVRLAREAKARKLILFHHAAVRSDKALDEIGWHASTLLPGTVVAYEGLSIRM